MAGAAEGIAAGLSSLGSSLMKFPDLLAEVEKRRRDEEERLELQRKETAIERVLGKQTGFKEDLFLDDVTEGGVKTGEPTKITPTGELGKKEEKTLLSDFNARLKSFEKEKSDAGKAIDRLSDAAKKEGILGTKKIQDAVALLEKQKDDADLNIRSLSGERRQAQQFETREARLGRETEATADQDSQFQDFLKATAGQSAENMSNQIGNFDMGGANFSRARQFVATKRQLEADVKAGRQDKITKLRLLAGQIRQNLDKPKQLIDIIKDPKTGELIKDEPGALGSFFRTITFRGKKPAKLVGSQKILLNQVLTEIEQLTTGGLITERPTPAPATTTAGAAAVPGATPQATAAPPPPPGPAVAPDQEEQQRLESLGKQLESDIAKWKQQGLSQDEISKRAKGKFPDLFK